MLGILAHSWMTAARQTPKSEGRTHYEEERRWLRDSRAARAKGGRHD
ncbi:hypothetical protein ACOXXX_04840 [Thalassococcus sp. BH17M4-6]